MVTNMSSLGDLVIDSGNKQLDSKIHEWINWDQVCVADYICR